MNAIVLRRYVLFILPKLTSLDTLLLAEETKQLAEATFLKKQMYYNMRIKTMLRNARNIIRLANEGKKVGILHHMLAGSGLGSHRLDFLTPVLGIHASNRIKELKMG